MFKKLLPLLIASGMMQFTVEAAPAAEAAPAPAKKICKKTGKPCTGDDHAKHTCKAGDKECRKHTPAPAPAKKICKKTGKPCTGDMNAAHNCKAGDKECSKDHIKKAPAKHNCERAQSHKRHNCKRVQVPAQKICEKTGKPCTGDVNAAHNCKVGDKECSKDSVKKNPVKKAPAKQK